MAVSDNPAQPSTANEATTQNESQGGFFTDTAGVGIDLSGVVGPPGADGRGIATIIASPTNPALGEDVTVTVTYTDGSAPASFTVAAGERGTTGPQGASVIPVFFRIVSTNPTTGLPDNIDGVSETLQITDTHYTLVRSDNDLYIDFDGNFNIQLVVRAVELGEVGYSELSVGQDGADGVSFVDIFSIVTFNPTGIADVLSPSTAFDRDSTGASVSHTYRSFVRADNPLYFTNNDIDSFNNTPSLRAQFISDVEDGTLPISQLTGPQGEQGDPGTPGTNGAMGQPGLQGPMGDDGLIFVPIFYTEEGGSISNASLTEMAVHTHVSYYRSDNPLRRLIFARRADGTNTYDPDIPALDPLVNTSLFNARSQTPPQIGQHTLGDRGPEGDPGPMGNPGVDGNTVTVWYATSADGQNATTTYTDEQFIAFETHTATSTPTQPTEFERFVGMDGMDGAEAPRIATIAIQNETIDAQGDNIVTLRITLNNTPASTYDVMFTAPQGPQGERGQTGTGGGGVTLSAGPGIQIVGTEASVDLAANSGLEFTTTDTAGQLRVNVGDGLAITAGELHTTGVDTDTTYSLTVEDHANGAQLVLTDLLTSMVVATHPIVGMDDVIVSHTGGTIQIQGHDTSYTFTVREQSPAGTGDIELVIMPDVGDPASTQIISVEEGTGVDFELIDAQTFRINAASEIPTGTGLPTTGQELGDVFVVIGNAIPEMDGYYYYDGTTWIKDVTRINNQLGNWTITNDTTQPTSLDTLGRMINLGDDHDPNAALAVWTSGTAYEARDQVIHDGGSNVNSIYVARAAITGTVPPHMDEDNWYLVRSGIVSVQANNEADPHPLTGNTTLHFIDGPGIDITRRDESADFTIGVQHTGTHDVDEFTPGWAYTYYDIENNVSRTGEVLDSVGNATFNEGFFIRAGVRLIFSSGDVFSDGDMFAFRTYGTVDVPTGETAGSRTVLFPTATQDYIVYCQRTTSPTRTAEATILQIDPPVNTIDELAALFGATSDGDRRIFNPELAVSLFGLDEHHDTPTQGTYAWAHTGNTSRIPTNKLPTDIAYTQSVDVTRSADDTTAEAIAIDANGALSLTLQPQPKVVNDLDDVNLTQPTETPVVEGLLWDATEEEWTNSAISQTLEGLTDTAIPTPGNEQYLQYSTERGNDAQGDPLPPAWVAVDLPETADGRIEFTALDADTYEASAFIPDRANPEDPLPAARAIRSAGFVNSQLRFNLATATTLTLTVQNFSPPNLAWDVPFAGGTRQAIGSTDTLFPDQVLQNLFTNSGNITIAPTSGPGPWTISFTDPSLVGDPNDAGDQLAGGSTTAIAFRATNSVTGANADESGMVVSWNSAGLTVNDQRFPTNPTFFNTFLDPYTGFNVNYTVTATGTTLTNSAVWTANGTTIAGNGTVGPTANTGTNTNSIGGNAGAVRINSDYVTYHGQPDVPTDIIRVEFNRPDGVSTAGAYTVALTHNASSQPNWFYPIGSFSQEGTPTDPDMATIRDSLSSSFRQGTTDPTDPIPNFSISLPNSGTSSRSLYIAYPSDTSDAPNYPTNPLVITQITTLNGSSSGPVNVTIAEANHSAAPINIISDAAGTPADSGVNYNWFRVTVAPNATVDITAINP